MMATWSSCVLVVAVGAMIFSPLILEIADPTMLLLRMLLLRRNLLVSVKATTIGMLISHELVDLLIFETVILLLHQTVVSLSHV